MKQQAGLAQTIAWKQLQVLPQTHVSLYTLSHLVQTCPSATSHKLLIVQGVTLLTDDDAFIAVANAVHKCCM